MVPFPYPADSIFVFFGILGVVYLTCFAYFIGQLVYFPLMSHHPVFLSTRCSGLQVSLDFQFVGFLSLGSVIRPTIIRVCMNQLFLVRLFCTCIPVQANEVLDEGPIWSANYFDMPTNKSKASIYRYYARFVR